jgi:hypothetical protein
MGKTKVLTKKLIDQIPKKPPQEQGPYESFTEIEDEAAIHLSKKVKVSPSLYLSGLTSPLPSHEDGVKPIKPEAKYNWAKSGRNSLCKSPC